MPVTSDSKETPSASWIESLRTRFPTETFVDLALTRKLQQRLSGPYHAQSVESVAARLQVFLDKRVPKPFTVSGLRQLTGGASKEQFSFQLDAAIGLAGQQSRRMVLRMQPTASPVESHRLREFQVMDALKGIIPVPDALWVDPDGEELGQSSLICSFCNGVVRPPQDSQVMSPRMNFGPKYRALLWPEFAKYLAALHTFDWSRASLSSFEKPPVGSNAGTIRLINWWERVWEEDSLVPDPLMTVVSQWLRRNAPPIDRVSLVHGDYRSGNFLFDLDTGRITAVLDWEMSWLGDRHADLAYVIDALWSEVDEEGRVLACGLCSAEELFEEYERQSGLRIDQQRVAYYEVLMRWRSVIQCLATAARCVYGKRTHQDILFSWIMGNVVPPLLRDLQSSFERVA